ncbi:elongation of very long chain fatty acids protein 6-like [Branchiostoma floridae]|uniref:Elongation of very long chain fatty acids protein n=1 Tax=Branchiostoma floridae TaxID=7739 RepID=A0A9J7MXR0_BRAFL|nr:elongation of very long chain fatty acids protein 6-like [Branchiostoma floridae]
MSSPIAVEKMAVPEAEDLRSLVEPFGFEERFDSAGFHRWFRARWWWSAVFSAAYVLLVFGGRSLMRHREPFRLRLPLVLWNTGLAVFSILGALRTNVTLAHIILQKGFLFSVCKPLLLTGPVTGFWAAAYSISKSVCMFKWYAYSELAGPVGYFVAMNYTVHAVMYSYFAVRAAGYRLPRKLSMAITVLQSSQMVGGLLIGGYAHLTYQSGEACHWSDFASLLCVAMYGSYLVLFLHFFAKSYVSKTPRPKKD